MMLEAMLHDDSWFVTLTYGPRFLPVDGSVSPNHLRLFLMRLRKAIAPVRIRYYAVGEYGEMSWRPHYHLILFGLPRSKIEAIDKAWIDVETKKPLGMVHVGDVTMQSAGYCAAYVQKGMTKRVDPRLGGRHPEFCRMSLKPGIGAGAIDGEFAKAMVTRAGAASIANAGAVPNAFRFDGKLHPFGRYLRARLAAVAGHVADPDRKYIRKRFSERELVELYNLMSHEDLVRQELANRDRKRVVTKHRLNTMASIRKRSFHETL